MKINIQILLVFLGFSLFVSCNNVTFDGKEKSNTSAQNDDATQKKVDPESPSLSQDDSQAPASEEASHSSEDVLKDEPTPELEEEEVAKVTEEEVEKITDNTEIKDVEIILSENPCLIPELVAQSTTEINMNTILKTLTLHLLLYDDGIFEFFPTVDSEEKFLEFIRKNITDGNGGDFAFEDGWCQPFKISYIDVDSMTISFTSSGQDKTLLTDDDLNVIWDGTY